MFIYHMVPQNFSGDTLFPLNRLNDVLPVQFDANKKRYETKPELMRIKVPYLNCQWNDVLHFSPVNIKRLFVGLTEAGFSIGYDIPFFKIPVEKIEHLPSVWFTKDVASAPEAIVDSEFQPFDPELYREVPDIPQATKDYYSRSKREGMGRPQYLFVYSPHILVRGSVKVDDCEIVSWNA